MRLAIFGASGRAGRHAVKLALAQGHSLTALVRTPAKLGLAHERLTLVQGDVQDSAKVAQTVAGAEAVLSVLGPASNEPVFAVSGGINHILTAMKTHQVRRLVMSVGAGVRDPNDAPGLPEVVIGLLVKTFSRNVYEDMARADSRVRASDLDWTIVRVPMLTDDPATGRVRVGYVGRGVGARLSRADLAEFMLKQVGETQYLRQAPAISN